MSDPAAIKCVLCTIHGEKLRILQYLGLIGNKHRHRVRIFMPIIVRVFGFVLMVFDAAAKVAGGFS